MFVIHQWGLREDASTAWGEGGNRQWGKRNQGETDWRRKLTREEKGRRRWSRVENWVVFYFEPYIDVTILWEDVELVNPWHRFFRQWLFFHGFNIQCIRTVYIMYLFIHFRLCRSWTNTGKYSYSYLSTGSFFRSCHKEFWWFQYLLVCSVFDSVWFIISLYYSFMLHHVTWPKTLSFFYNCLFDHFRFITDLKSMDFFMF